MAQLIVQPGRPKAANGFPVPGWVPPGYWKFILEIEEMKNPYALPPEQTADMLGPGYRTGSIGVFDENQMYGYLVYTTDGKATVTIETLYVWPEYRRKKVGTSLVKFVTDSPITSKFKTVRMIVPERNLRVLNFLKSQGFRAISLQREHFAEYEDGYVLTRGIRLPVQPKPKAVAIPIQNEHNQNSPRPVENRRASA